jgi:iron(II)-dependent oxidoreductase
MGNMQLADYQSLLLDHIRDFGENHYATRFHPDLSPAGWHLGHCIYTESYWIRERWLAMETIDPDLKRLYVPELSSKPARSERIAPYQQLLDWSQQVQSENQALIREHRTHAGDHELMQDGYLLGFLQQHYAQHIETVQMIRAQHRLQLDAEDNGDLTTTVTDPVDDAWIEISAGEYPIGSTGHWHYDNEKIAFTRRLDGYLIAEHPVTNHQYRHFIDDGGYRRPELWSGAGRRWKENYGPKRPEYWRVNGHNNWLQATADGCEPLADAAPVIGINYHEAGAFAAWAGARLPHEYEWEAAAAGGRLKAVGQCWEWCANAFHPYAGFKAYPYDGYSLPWFDNNHFVLRGSSRYTLDIIRRPSFRNYYEADKRHIFAGLRLARTP